MSDLVETALRTLFRAQHKRNEVLPLQSFHSGGMLVDVANHEALHDAMDRGQ
jgi:hypothetical protein